MTPKGIEKWSIIHHKNFNQPKIDSVNDKQGIEPIL